MVPQYIVIIFIGVRLYRVSKMFQDGKTIQPPFTISCHFRQNTVQSTPLGVPLISTSFHFTQKEPTMITHRTAILLPVLLPVFLCLFAPLVCGAESKPANRPNIVFVLTDDQNYDTIGCFGANVLTPHMDRLANEGVRFIEAFTVHSICTPSRYVCLTGQYASRCETPTFLAMCPPNTPSIIGFNVQTPEGTWNVANALQNAGYVTGFFGKWHTGAPPRKRPLAESDLGDPAVKKQLTETHDQLCGYIRAAGFDVADRVYHGNIEEYRLDGLKFHNQEWIAEGALNFIDKYQDSEKPFYLHVCTTLQHSPSPNMSLKQGDPRQTPVGLLDKLPDVQPARETIAPRLRAAGVPENMGHATWLDDSFGAIIDRLKKYDLLDNTAIFVFSDNATMRGKGTCYDGGMKVPAFVYWKGHFSSGVVCDKLIGNIDYVPTILDIAGVQKPDDVIMDGESFLPLVTGVKDTPWRDFIYLEVGHSRAVRTNKWKYLTIRYPQPMQQKIANNTLGRPAWHADTVFDLQAIAERNHPYYWDLDQLYDMENDPTEQKNLISDTKCAAVLSDLKRKMSEAAQRFPRPYGEFTH